MVQPADQRYMVQLQLLSKTYYLQMQMYANIVYVCVCIHYVYIYKYTHVCKFVYMQICIRAFCIFVYIYIYMHIHIHIHLVAKLRVAHQDTTKSSRENNGRRHGKCVLERMSLANRGNPDDIRRTYPAKMSDPFSLSMLVMWVKKCICTIPQSSLYIYRWYSINHSLSWVVHDMIFP